ncbi:MAG TPA: lysylphosphatidylglycerol synthase domain-containing protein [Gemmatimonadales bacterium]|nr:lysylphosphatidylglycerol synthase domain-containing protein [Gemmatimonadales bacterium]
MRSRWFRLVQAAVGLAILWFAGRTLLRNWHELAAQPLEWRVSPGLLALAVFLVWAMYGVLIASWRVMLTAWGEHLDGWSAARIWTVSNLGKYLPGKVWAIAGMALMARQSGVAPAAATGSAVILQAVSVGTGAAVAGLTGAAALERARPGAMVGLWVLIAAAVVGIGLLLWPPVLRRVLRLATPEAAQAAPPLPAILFGAAANVVAWVGYGVALWLLARGLLPGAGLGIRGAIAVFTASYLAGFLALIAPGGLGVREGLFILMLQGTLGLGAATALALASRVLLTVTELGAAVPFLLAPRRNARVAH